MISNIFCKKIEILLDKSRNSVYNIQAYYEALNASRS